MRRTAAGLRQLQDATGVAQRMLTETAAAAAAKATDLATVAKATMVERLPRKQGIAVGQDTDPYADIDWDRADYTVAVASGLFASLVDTVFVGTPKSNALRFSRWAYPGSPLTGWLHPHRHVSAYKFFKRFDVDVPYDARYPGDTDLEVGGLDAPTHRLRSFGHEPLVGFPIGLADLMTGMGTYSNEYGKVRRYHEAGFRPVGPLRALRLQVRHVLSDFYTPAGVPPPLFSLLQLVPGPSLFSVGISDEGSPWATVALEMFRDGYDLRHFATMAIVPVTVEANIRAYWRLTGGIRPDPVADRTRLASMLLVGHTIALSGDLLKTGLVFKGEPTALNWAQMLAMPYTAVAWVRASAARDARLRRGADEERKRRAADETVRPEEGAA